MLGFFHLVCGLVEFQIGRLGKGLIDGGGDSAGIVGTRREAVADHHPSDFSLVDVIFHIRVGHRDDDRADGDTGDGVVGRIVPSPSWIPATPPLVTPIAIVLGGVFDRCGSQEYIGICADGHLGPAVGRHIRVDGLQACVCVDIFHIDVGSVSIVDFDIDHDLVW